MFYNLFSLLEISQLILQNRKRTTFISLLFINKGKQKKGETKGATKKKQFCSNVKFAKFISTKIIQRRKKEISPYTCSLT